MLLAYQNEQCSCCSMFIVWGIYVFLTKLRHQLKSAATWKGLCGCKAAWSDVDVHFDCTHAHWNISTWHDNSAVFVLFWVWLCTGAACECWGVGMLIVCCATPRTIVCEQVGVLCWMCDERVLCLYTFVIVCIVFESTMLCIDSTQHNLVLLFSSAAGTLKQISLTGQLYRMVCLLRELMCEVCVCG